jgi:hypothetical protein
MTPFEALWKRFYPQVPPVSTMMRKADVPSWVRFHSLPESQRYPDNQLQMQVVLARQNTLAAEVLGIGAPCWLSQSWWVPPPDMAEPDEEEYWVRREYNLSLAFRFVQKFEFDPAFPREVDGPDNEFDAYAVRTAWTKGAFDKLLSSIASEMFSPPTVWISETTGAVFAPYDGGVDLFLPNAAMVDHLRRKHSDWLPGNPEGL